MIIPPPGEKGQAELELEAQQNKRKGLNKQIKELEKKIADAQGVSLVDLLNHISLCSECSVISFNERTYTKGRTQF
jgi:hypothetical protein